MYPDTFVVGAAHLRVTCNQEGASTVNSFSDTRNWAGTGVLHGHGDLSAAERLRPTTASRPRLLVQAPDLAYARPLMWDVYAVEGVKPGYGQ